jgi:divalent metal cation (Fe/Co/Zn/Cd) transporter
MWSSLVVLAGLIAVDFGHPWADSAAAIIVAVFICIAAWRLGRRTVDTLTDTAPAGVAVNMARDVAHIARFRSIEPPCLRTASLRAYGVPARRPR